MLNQINSQISPQKNFTQNKKSQSLPSFTAKGDLGLKAADKWLKHQESLSLTRFIQDVTTNWVPKVVLTRSAAEFTEMSFLEYTESALFYFVPTWFGNFFSKAYSKFHPEKLKKIINTNITKSAEEIIKDKKLEKDGAAKRILSTKAAVILACTAIPAGEYALSFAKNLLTLNVFKKSNFNNVVNLNKNKEDIEDREDKGHQEKVRKSAHRHIKNAGILSIGGLGASFIFAKYGHKSEALQKASKLILQPGAYISKGLDKIGLHSDGVEKFLKKYITPDFDRAEVAADKLKNKILDEEGKAYEFSLSKGQLLVSTVSGFFGYSEAGKDRGKLDQYEVWSRVPFVVLYTVFGSAAFDYAFNKIFIKKNIFPDIIKKDKNNVTQITPTKDLAALAEKIAKVKNTLPKAELSRLTKEKAIITSIPYCFGLVFMGFFLAGINRFWTQHRYNKIKKVEQENKIKEKNANSSEINFKNLIQQPKPNVFKALTNK